jgi:L-histidine Nalpha-methyltransferase
MAYNHASDRVGSVPLQHRPFLRDVLAGLAAKQRNIPCKWLYDARGTALFEQICRTNDYYVTRTELGLLRENAKIWAAHAGPNVELLEPGAGSGEKAAILLSEMVDPAGFIPFDISPTATQLAAQTVSGRCPGLPIEARIGDFTDAHDRVPRLATSQRRLLFFPGSTLGNFDRRERSQVLRTFRGWLQPGDLFLVGVDLIKDRGVLERAYDDREGVTAAFNLNLLARAQRELHASLDVRGFRHRAVFNNLAQRIEMHLVSERRQTVSVGQQRFEFLPGEFIHTENSHKFETREFAEEVRAFGFRLIDRRQDSLEYFSHLLFEATNAGVA